MDAVFPEFVLGLLLPVCHHIESLQKTKSLLEKSERVFPRPVFPSGGFQELRLQGVSIRQIRITDQILVIFSTFCIGK